MQKNTTIAEGLNFNEVVQASFFEVNKKLNKQPNKHTQLKVEVFLSTFSSPLSVWVRFGIGRLI